MKKDKLKATKKGESTKGVEGESGAGKNCSQLQRVIRRTDEDRGRTGEGAALSRKQAFSPRAGGGMSGHNLSRKGT